MSFVGKVSCINIPSLAVRHTSRRCKGLKTIVDRSVSLFLVMYIRVFVFIQYCICIYRIVNNDIGDLFCK
jgi:hypothetical protein